MSTSYFRDLNSPHISSLWGKRSETFIYVQTEVASFCNFWPQIPKNTLTEIFKKGYIKNIFKKVMKASLDV